MDDRHSTKDLLLNLLNQTSDNIYFKDLESRFILVNEAFSRWVGCESPEELVGKSDVDLFNKQHAEPALRDELHIIETQESLLSIEEKEVWPDGRVTWVSSSKMPLFDNDGDLIGTFGVSRDITAHKEAELKLAKYAEKLEHLNNQIREDLAMADQYQRAFLPKAYPRFALEGQSQYVEFGHYYKAGGQIGGDFCAIRKLSDHEISIFICDVMGHGVRSALVTGIVRAVSEEVLPVEHDPGRLLSRMNLQLFPLLRQNEDFVFVTACCLVLDLQTGILKYSSAGHPAPLFFKLGGSSQVLPLQDVEKQPALPFFKDTEYVTSEVVLDPNDVVIVYTDGLTEATNSQGDEYGTERLGECLATRSNESMSTLLDALVQDACAFGEYSRFDDDVCMAGLRFHRTIAPAEQHA
jgi:sigma-B regulation protein RsbU (phosphoserine phosphatase)